MSTPKSTIKKVNIDDLHFYEDIQRAERMDERRVGKMAEVFNPKALGVVTLSLHSDGRLFVLDGRHRIAAARLAGHTQNIDARIITGLSRPEEADLFRLLNASKQVSAMSLFLAGVIAQDPDEVAINQIVESLGWKVSLNSDDGHISAVTALDRLYRGAAIGNNKAGPFPELTERTLRTITEAWEWDRKSADAPIVLGVGQLYARFGGEVDDVKLVAEMRDTRPGTLIGKAKALRDIQGGTVPAAVAKVLVGMHNKRRRTNLLPEWVWTR